MPTSLRPTNVPPSPFPSRAPTPGVRTDSWPRLEELSIPIPSLGRESWPRIDEISQPPPSIRGEARPRLDDARSAAREQAALVQAQKLQAIGQLASGIAHEINTPTQFVNDNVVFLQEAFTELVQIAGAASELLEAAGAGVPSLEAVRRARAIIERSEPSYLLDNVPRALEQCLEGLRRVASIVAALKNFSRPSGAEKQLVDLREPIESTLVVARSEWKGVADVDTDFAPDLPPVPCLRDELGQVVLNLVVNAAHAIADVAARGGAPKGRIVVSTRRAGRWAELRVRDTGGGIPEEVRDRVFEPFFTTKPFGKGSGQGLAIAWAVVVEKHGGTLTFDVDEGIGTTFVVRLPLTAEGGAA